MILRDSVAQCIAEQQYLIPRPRSLVPSAHVVCLHAIVRVEAIVCDENQYAVYQPGPELISRTMLIKSTAPQAVVLGDIAPIRIGSRVNIPDGTILHTPHGTRLDIADDVGIGHRAVVHCRRIGRRTLIGIGAILFDNGEVGSGPGEPQALACAACVGQTFQSVI